MIQGKTYFLLKSMPFPFHFFSTTTRLSVNIINRSQQFVEAMEQMLDQRLDFNPKCNCNHIFKLGIEKKLKSSE
jgi:hypothetical protein